MKIGLNGLLLLDVQFRHTVDPLSQAQGVNPLVDVPMEVALLKGDVPNTYAVTLRVTIDAPGSLYAFTIAYAAFLTFDPEGAEVPPDIENRITVTGANMAFPYCRELISNITSRARFGTTWLNPTNFSDLFKKSENVENAVATR